MYINKLLNNLYGMNLWNMIGIVYKNLEGKKE